MNPRTVAVGFEVEIADRIGIFAEGVGTVLCDDAAALEHGDTVGYGEREMGILLLVNRMYRYKTTCYIVGQLPCI